MTAKIIRMHEEATTFENEPHQWEVAVDLDIAVGQVHTPAVEDMLSSLALRIERTILSDPALLSKMKRHGVTFVGVRVDKC